MSKPKRKRQKQSFPQTCGNISAGRANVAPTSSSARSWQKKFPELPGGAERRSRTSNTKSEKQIQAEIVKALNQIPGVWCRANIATAYSGSGNPDIDGCCCGRAFYGEVKRPGEKTTKIQDAVMRRIKQAGGVCHIWTSKEQAVADVQRLKYVPAADSESR